jgi:hypothetical protein
VTSFTEENAAETIQGVEVNGKRLSHADVNILLNKYELLGTAVLTRATMTSASKLFGALSGGIFSISSQTFSFKFRWPVLPACSSHDEIFGGFIWEGSKATTASAKKGTCCGDDNAGGRTFKKARQEATVQLLTITACAV